MIETIGYLAAICTTISFAPQAILLWKTKNTASISLSMYCIFNLGILLWLSYGILTNQIPLILANSVTFLLSFSILAMKINNLKKENNKN